MDRDQQPIEGFLQALEKIIGGHFAESNVFKQKKYLDTNQSLFFRLTHRFKSHYIDISVPCIFKQSQVPYILEKVNELNSMMQVLICFQIRKDSHLCSHQLLFPSTEAQS